MSNRGSRQVIRPKGHGVLQALCLCIAASMLSACAHQVRLAELQPPPHEGPRTNLVFAAEGKGIRGSYIPWSGDTLVMRASSSAVSGCSDRGATSLPITSAALEVAYRGGTERLELTDRPISEILLSTAVPSEKTPIVHLSTRPGEDRRIELRKFGPRTTWAQYREALDDMCRQAEVTLDIIPVERAFAQPGDQIVVTRQSLITDAFSVATAMRQAELSRLAGAGTRDVERFELTVDSEGAVHLPPITRLAQFELYGSGGGGLVPGRAYANALLAPANSRLVVTDLPLPTLAACLSVAEVSSEERDCSGLDGRYAPTGGDGGARREITYTIEPGVRSWFLVDPRGQRIALPYQYGMTVLEAVASAYPGWSGHELPGPGRGYLTVVPRAGSHEVPFFAALGDPQGMGTVLLEPGDTVHLTVWKPE